MANFTVEYRPYMSIGWNDDRLRARDSVVIHHDFSARRWIPTAVLVGILSIATPITLWAMLSHEHDNTMEWVGYWVAVGVPTVDCRVDTNRQDRHPGGQHVLRFCGFRMSEPGTPVKEDSVTEDNSWACLIQ